MHIHNMNLFKVNQNRAATNKIMMQQFFLFFSIILNIGIIYKYVYSVYTLNNTIFYATNGSQPSNDAINDVFIVANKHIHTKENINKQ